MNGWRIVFSFVLGTCITGVVLGQQIKCSFPTLGCQVEPPESVLRNIEGQVGFYFKNKETGVEQFEPPFDACISLFSENRKKLIKAFVVRADGRFVINGIADGSYWLVVNSNGGLTPARFRIKIDQKSKKNRQVKITLAPLNMHSCSTAEITTK